jgi:hypothetical protein
MAKGNIRTGITVGNGAAINVELGWIPTHVQVFNATDGTLITAAFLSWVVPFTSGGTAVISPGSTIKGLTSKAVASVRDVLLYSGTFSGGDAAGFLVLEEGSLVGTFGAENIVVTNLASGTIGTDDATVTANINHNVGIATQASPATGTSAISRYEGVAALNSQGFTIGSVLAVEAKVLRYLAFRDDA